MPRIVEIVLIELLPLVLLLVGVAFGLLLWRLLRRRSGSQLRYACRESVLTEPERAFLGALDRAVGSEYRVLAKVRVADVVRLAGSGGAKRRQAALDRITATHFDFLLCRADTLAPACVIELDDRSRQRSQRESREVFVNTLCRETGLSLLRVPVRPAYAVSRLRNLIRERLAAAELPGVDASREPWIGDARPPDADTPTREPPAPGTDPTCPRCGSAMTARSVSSGAHAGRRVWRCVRYPECPAVVTDTRSRTARGSD